MNFKLKIIIKKTIIRKLLEKIREKRFKHKNK